MPVTLKWTERLRAGIGALIAIALTAGIAQLIVGRAAVPTLVAPMGASAVLLFGVPASPLAQPWSIIGGNLISACVGVTCAYLIPDPTDAAALAVGLAICAMFALRCLHPPSGAVALTAVLGGPSIHALGYGFVLAPIAIQSAALLSTAIVFHTLSGHRYPHGHAGSIPTASPQGLAGIAGTTGIARARLDAALARRGELLDIDPDDLEALLREMHQETAARATIDLVSAGVVPRADLGDHPILVIDRDDRLAGMFTVVDRMPGLYRHSNPATFVAMSTSRTLVKSDFEQLSEFRYQMRRFERFSERAAQSEGVTPLQYLLLLHIKGYPERAWATIGELAERLQSHHHGVVALVTRCEALGLVRREQSPDDRRQVQVHLETSGERLLARLAALHRAELKSLRGAFSVPQIDF